ncbi:MAG: SirB2 family protein [Pseudomonadales bacterium]|nr:SirB2 family protein [Pseudomonadales bacterium]MCP5329923.1 SirB2 family protein [Pseudomonadales bacterium]MCP5343186.1 SirB2 family protein [Pseudomonadales bacterium]
MYTLIKIIHMSCAMISVLGFLARGILKINESALVEKKLVKVLPHIIDTVLLVSAITLVVMSGQYPWVAPWVGAKIVALFVYIGLGVVVMRTAKTRQARIIAFALALATAAYIFMVAGTKTIF